MKIVNVLVILACLNITPPILAEQHSADDDGMEEEIEIINASHISHAGILMNTMALPVHPTMSFGNYSMGHPDVMFGRLFPPAMIMRNQSRLDLSDRQKEAIKKEMRTFQSGIVDVQWDLNTTTAELKSGLAKEKIKLDDSMKLVDKVLKAENTLKKMHLALLINIRNVLDEDQVNTLKKSTLAIFMGHDAPTPSGDMMMKRSVHIEP